MRKVRLFKSFVLMRRIDRLIEASKEHAFIGAAHPDDHEAIEKEFHEAKMALVDYIMEFIL